VKSLIKWSVENTPAMNTLMIGVLLAGAVSLFGMRREIFPEFDLEIIYVAVPYPGAAPEEVEESICQRIEEAVSSIDGIKKQTSVAREGSGAVILELESNVDVQKTLGEVKNEIDGIKGFLPVLAEEPVVKQITLRNDAIRIGVMGPASEGGADGNGAGGPGNGDEAELRLREIAEGIRDEVKNLPSVSQARLVGTPQYQIDIEISEDTLRKYGMTLKKVAQLVRGENIEIPGGKIRTPSQEVLLRGKNKHMTGEEIAKIPLITRPDGVVLTVGDLGTVRDEFADITSINRVNGKPAAVIAVEKTASEDLLAIVAEVQDYIAKKEAQQRDKTSINRLPDGYSLETWADQSVMVRDRLELLSRNGIQGMILVFVVLAIFLEMRLAFWVALGVPLSILGACGILLVAGQTLNMLTMFAFLMALGILVDDAIVVGENVYAHRQRGSGFVKAAIEGTVEVLPSVMASVCTTIIAFAPLLFVSGVIGKFIAVMPLAIIAMLLISLFEVTFILPCHLAHGHGNGHGGGTLSERIIRYCREMTPWARYTFGALVQAICFTFAWLFYPFRRLAVVFAWLNRKADVVLNWIIERFYQRLLRWSLGNKLTVVCTAVAIMCMFVGLIAGEIVPWVFFPKLDSNMIQASITYPDGTPAALTEEATRRMEAAIVKVGDELVKEGYTVGGVPLTTVIHRAVGTSPVANLPVEPAVGDSHAGGVMVELVETSYRNIASEKISARWREAAGEFPGAESVSFGSQAHGPGGKPIEFKLLGGGKDMEPLEKAAERCKEKLRTYPGLTDIIDDSQPGKWEFQLKKKDEARAMGLSLRDLTETVRGAYYGEEVMRLQRGRHEVKLMVRYPRDDRRSLANFDNIRVRDGGFERPITELVDVHVGQGYSAINRKDQYRSITVTADIKHGSGANASNISKELKEEFLPELLAEEEFEGIEVTWDGQQRQTQESLAGLGFGLGISLIAMFGLLTFEFRSYFQPILILCIIPFGAGGAILGHRIMGLDLTIFSVFGMVALSGVVINDSIVLIDFINHRVRDGLPLKVALLDAGRQRFRPVLLTSLTTVAGLLPLLMETSMQAQVLIPMATSLCFGLMFSTILILVLVPTFYMIYARVTGLADDGPDGDGTLVDPQPRYWNDGDGGANEQRDTGPAAPVSESPDDDDDRYSDPGGDNDGIAPDRRDADKTKVLTAGTVSPPEETNEDMDNQRQTPPR